MLTMKKKLLTLEDEVLISFLERQKRTRNIVMIAAIFAIIVGSLGIFMYFKEPSDRDLWGGLYFISFGVAMIVINKKFIQILELIKKLQSNR
jgi:hypothetical protein